MAHHIKGRTLSEAWLLALEWLLRHERAVPTNQMGKDVNLCVTFPGTAQEESLIREALDDFLTGRSRLDISQGQADTNYPVHTVSNTLFPASFYHAGIEGAREHLYAQQQLIEGVQRRVRANRRGTYFDRLISYPGPKGPINQLENTVKKLQKRTPRGVSSTFEINVGHPLDDALGASSADDGADLHVYIPHLDQDVPLGFPCLSHISLTYHVGRLSLTAVYRNQHFVRKAYGNYLGLSRLLHFLCTECGLEPGEITCIASHADAELSFGRKRLTLLTQACRPELQLFERHTA